MHKLICSIFLEGWLQQTLEHPVWNGLKQEGLPVWRAGGVWLERGELWRDLLNQPLQFQLGHWQHIPDATFPPCSASMECFVSVIFPSSPKYGRNHCKANVASSDSSH